jgi:D-alanyl-D-alanine dipeptidase
MRVAPSNHLSLGDPIVAQIPVVESHEPLIPLANLHPKVILDISENNQSHHGRVLDYRLRQGAAERLIAAATLLPGELGFLIKESMRPLALQEHYFNRRLARIRERYPRLSAEEAYVEASKFTAPPNVAAHPSGGAIDLTLVADDGQELDLGCQYDQDEVKSEGRCYSFASDLSLEARKNREILFQALAHSGFVNYPFEWWHWSYGDRYWALLQNQPYALYGPVAEG